MARKLILLTIALLMSVHSYADSSFTTRGATINSTQAPQDYTLKINTPTGMRLQPHTGSSFLNIDLSVAGRCFINGYNNRVNFYDPIGQYYLGVLARSFISTTSTANSSFAPMDTEGIFDINPVSFKWKRSDNETSVMDSEVHYGFIAQEVEEVFPQMVVEDNNGTKMVDYTSIIPVLVKAIQVLEEEIEAQNQELKLLIKEKQILIH